MNHSPQTIKTNIEVLQMRCTTVAVNYATGNKEQFRVARLRLLDHLYTLESAFDDEPTVVMKSIAREALGLPPEEEKGEK